MLLSLVCACSAYDPALLKLHSPALRKTDASSSAIGAANEASSEPSSDAASDATSGTTKIDAGPSCEASDTDIHNCGSCGHVCAVENGEPACVAGACTVSSCRLGFADCDGDHSACETQATTATDCGGCGTLCRDLPHAIASCATGSCQVRRCEAGYDDCDGRGDNGCETTLGSLNNCGACNVPCDKASCSGGVCTAALCGPGFADCDGDQVTCEANLQTDASNCGSCGSKCEVNPGVTAHGNLTCTAQGCGVACDEGYIDCDNDYRTGCDAFVDSDNDGIADCLDGCPNDPNKQSQGACGCGNSDRDSDTDGAPDCKDGCPLDPTQQDACLTFVPTNFDPRPINWSAQPATTLNCGTTTIDTTDPDGSGALVATITNWCGTAPVPVAQDQANGPSVVIVPLRGLTLSASNTLRLIGPRPLILAIDGTVTIDGTIDASGNGTTAGAGGNWSCGSSQGGNGQGYSNGKWSNSNPAGGSGAGGGGFASAGGTGGRADMDKNGGGNYSNKSYANGPYAGGVAGTGNRGNANLSPLLGGCAGGSSVDLARNNCPSNTGGGGGGAVQITSSVSITVTSKGVVRVNGGSGGTPCGASLEGGGSGGGSGGAILLESHAVTTTGATLQTNGGPGGKNGSSCGLRNCGNSNGGAGSTSASNAGGAGTDTDAGGSGGGGGYGRFRIATH